MSKYSKSFVKYVLWVIKDDELQEKYNKIWYKVSNSIKKGFNSEPVYNEKYLNTKIKSYDGKISNSHDYVITKEGSDWISHIDWFCL